MQTHPGNIKSIQKKGKDAVRKATTRQWLWRTSNAFQCGNWLLQTVPSFCGRRFPCYRIVSLSWKPGAFSIKLWPLCGSRKIRKPIPSFGAWGTGQGRMRSFVCWPPSGGQNAVPPVSTRSY